MFSSASRIPWSPRVLLNAGTLAALWFEPSDMSTLFQDVNGTIPVTAVGQSVAMIHDKSGFGYHATQSNATLRPTLQIDAEGYYYLDVGTSDTAKGLIIPPFPFPNSVGIYQGIGCYQTSYASNYPVVFYLRGSAYDNSHRMGMIHFVNTNRVVFQCGIVGVINVANPSPLNTKNVFSGSMIASRASKKLYKNGVLLVTGGASTLTDSGANFTGGYGNSMFGRLYTAIAMYREVTTQEQLLLDRYIGASMGLNF